MEKTNFEGDVNDESVIRKLKELIRKTEEMESRVEELIGERDRRRRGESPEE